MTSKQVTERARTLAAALLSLLKSELDKWGPMPGKAWVQGEGATRGEQAGVLA